MDIAHNMNITPLIDFEKIAEAKSYYEKLGYNEIPVPWFLSFEPYNATRPPDRREFFSLDGYLNASGEQGFLELMIAGDKLTKHCCITPCFRDERILDNIHHRYFIKLELINTDVSLDNLNKIIQDAKVFFEKYVPVKVIQTNIEGPTFDIVDTASNIELGSYGIRTYKQFSWIYGTGVALPRLDTVINLNK